MPIPLGILAVAGAGGGALESSFELIETTILTTNTTDVSFSNLNSYSQYNHLQVRATMKSSTTADNFLLRFNDDQGTNYAFHRFSGGGTTVGFSSSANETNILVTNGMAQSTVASHYSGTIIDLLDFSKTNKYKTARIFNGSAVSNNWVLFGSGVWLNTATIQKITITGSAAMVAGSRFSLYGVK